MLDRIENYAVALTVVLAASIELLESRALRCCGVHIVNLVNQKAGGVAWA
jgi:hypothetical protein